jgi:hypothetical protein
MREEYELKSGRPNPYVVRLASKDRAALVRWWTTVAENVRVLPRDLSREFPDAKSTVAALRLVVRLRRDGAKRQRAPRELARKRASR